MASKLELRRWLARANYPECPELQVAFKQGWDAFEDAMFSVHVTESPSVEELSTDYPCANKGEPEWTKLNSKRKRKVKSARSSKKCSAKKPKRSSGKQKKVLKKNTKKFSTRSASSRRKNRRKK